MSSQPINYQSHLFYIEKDLNRSVPQWFLEDVTRQEAEEKLKLSTNGNVLLRKCTTVNSSGKYAITYRRDSSRGSGCYRHYAVNNTPDGFLLDIEHKDNHPVKCLSEVMNLFVKLVGYKATPITSDFLPGYLKPNAFNSLEAHMSVNNNSDDIGSSKYVGGQSIKGDYVNINQEPNSADVLNTRIPCSAYVVDQSPAHSYINMPKTTSSDRNMFLSSRHEEAMASGKTNASHGYVNMQLMVNGHQTNRPAAGPENQLLPADDYPSDHPPPPPQWD